MKKKIDKQMKLRLNSYSRDLLIWRKECIEDLMNELAPTSRVYKEYIIRLKEILWLLSKWEGNDVKQKH